MKALVIAGGVPQIELIQQLKKRGIVTVLVDGNPNAVARPYADIFYHKDIFDILEIKGIAIKEGVDFIITVCADQVLLVVAQVSEMLGLPFYLDYQTALDVSDKRRMKEIFRKNGIPTTDYVELDHLDMKAIASLSFPMVVKPVDAYSSRGVRKCKDAAALKRYYQEAQRISRTEGVVVEEFFDGVEISVDAFVLKGKANILAITGSEKIKDEDRFVIYRGRYPIVISNLTRRRIEETVQKIADSFGLVNAPLLVQLLNRGDDISVLEFCARTGGNMKWLLIKYSCGVDVISATIDIALGKTPDITPKDIGNAVVVNDYVYCKHGVFDHIEGFDEMVDRGYINEYHQNRQRGWRFNDVESSSDRILGMNIVADSIEQFNRKEAVILDNVRVLDVDGRDIMRRELLLPLE